MVSKRLFLYYADLALNLSASTGPDSERPPIEHPHQHQLVRTLSLMDIIMVGIAGMIGGAIFVLTGPAIGLAGSAVILAFIINGIRGTWLGNAGSRGRISVDKRRITTAKCVYQWLDGMVCAHYSRKPLCCRLWGLLVPTPWPKRGWHI